MVINFILILDNFYFIGSDIMGRYRLYHLNINIKENNTLRIRPEYTKQPLDFKMFEKEYLNKNYIMRNEFFYGYVILDKEILDNNLVAMNVLSHHIGKTNIHITNYFNNIGSNNDEISTSINIIGKEYSYKNIKRRITIDNILD